MKILVADDSELYRHGLKSVLAYRLPLPSFVHAHSGMDALDKVERFSDLDMVILDLNLPDMRGLDVLNGILRKHRELPVDTLASAIQRILAGGVYFPPRGRWADCGFPCQRASG